MNDSLCMRMALLIALGLSSPMSDRNGLYSRAAATNLEDDEDDEEEEGAEVGLINGEGEDDEGERSVPLWLLIATDSPRPAFEPREGLLIP